jgi:adenosylcobyric acid synthase
MACGVAPQIDHNPVLLKPETDRIAQVVVHGEVRLSMQAKQFINSRDTLLPPVLESFSRLEADNELIIVEGAGSPAETNLRERDIANMGFARAADVPVCLLGDIERGGVIASIVGTKVVIDADDAAMIGGFAINKFRDSVAQSNITTAGRRCSFTFAFGIEGRTTSSYRRANVVTYGEFRRCRSVTTGAWR